MLVARRFKHTGILETQEEQADSSHDDDDDDEEEADDHCDVDGGRESDSVDSNVDNESSHTIDREVLHVNQDIGISEQHNAPIIDDIDIQELIKNLRSQYTSAPIDKESVSDDEDDDLISKQVPLQLPFSTFGVSGARLTHLFSELRERANLDLFQVPHIHHTTTNTAVSNNNSTTISPNVGNINNNTAQSSLFDADALVDELERHERMLKEFDDFLSDFQSIEPFGIVRPTVTVPSDLVRQQHQNVIVVGTVIDDNNDNTAPITSITTATTTTNNNTTTVSAATTLLTTRTPYSVNEM
ncbi:unnamed protein product [Schistosoma margrebowiei]|uniref:Uncharacterized protein n=1 Tax=Schistosoma margrebowiei TaxID=48269 RepID=A0A183LYC8_9TREM|nr:unnamed protein product [Schistosoma margrebowiei]